MTEREALVALNMVTGMGAITAKRLLERMGSFAAALQATEAELAGVPTLGAIKARQFAEAFRSVNPASEMARAERLRVRLLTWLDPDYPQALKTIADPPLVLYLRGETAALNNVGVAIVGTRHATVYGRETARRFGFQLAGAGYTVISGMAAGIDTEAHTGAVQAKGMTVGVLGGALDRFYPKENEPLARSIVQNGGAIISEYPFGRSPDRQTFPMRNRIVSGLSKGVLVIESPLSSGTMITVNQALDQNRIVMAVPGRIDSPASQGCHRLLREGARLVTNADEVIDELEDLVTSMRRAPASPSPLSAPDSPSQPEAAARPQPILSEDERAVLELLSTEGLSVDEIVRASGIDTGKVSSILVGLQIRRLAKALPGGRVARVP
ncbi:MAG: DNA-processing protein DprA [Kiritimatiellae bacterium]|nr:DNA-processing protein DprA [Kiritimatiellia bacterium]